MSGSEGMEKFGFQRLGGWFSGGVGVKRVI